MRDINPNRCTKRSMFKCWQLSQLVFIACSRCFLDSFVRENGKKSVISCFQSVMEEPPAIGSVITVKHNGFFRNGTARDAFYWRERPDIQWRSDNQSIHLVSLNHTEPLSSLLRTGRNQRTASSCSSSSRNHWDTADWMTSTNSHRNRRRDLDSTQW